MKITTVREFRDKATEMFRSKDAIIVLRRGEVAGLYFPFPTQTLPLEFKRELFAQITGHIRTQLAKVGLDEETILEDFETVQAEKARRRR